MSKTDWFRRTAWSDADREDFNARLKRSRGEGNKAQYLRIQAVYLAEAGHHHNAIELLDRLFAEFPQKGQLAQMDFDRRPDGWAAQPVGPWMTLEEEVAV